MVTVMVMVTVMATVTVMELMVMLITKKIVGHYLAGLKILSKDCNEY